MQLTAKKDMNGEWKYVLMMPDTKGYKLTVPGKTSYQQASYYLTGVNFSDDFAIFNNDGVHCSFGGNEKKFVFEEKKLEVSDDAQTRVIKILERVLVIQAWAKSLKEQCSEATIYIPDAEEYCFLHNFQLSRTGRC
jgi:hypothetical protein